MRLANQKRRDEQAETVRQQNRESYNRNRPAHNPEAIIVSTVRRSGTLETAPHNQDELNGVVMRCQQLKTLNGDEKIYTLDHDLPAAGIEIDGVMFYGRATAENLKPMEIKSNQQKKNSFDGSREISPQIATMGMNEALRVSRNDTTEELRHRFMTQYGYSTKADNSLTRAINDLPTDDKEIKQKAKTRFEAAKAMLVCELRLCGVKSFNLDREPKSFSDVWSAEQNKYVPFAIPVNKSFYPENIQRKLLDAYQWLNEVENQKFWFSVPAFNPGIEPPAIFNTDGWEERTQDHFAEWVNLWQRDRWEEPKAIFDVCKLVDVPTMRRLTDEHTKASLARLDDEKRKAA
ncbi:hypothetical protein D8U42_23560 [Salmonella enterica]|nr:hypothetical protein [Salmonella enterica]